MSTREWAASPSPPFPSLTPLFSLLSSFSGGYMILHFPKDQAVCGTDHVPAPDLYVLGAQGPLP